MQSDYGDQQQHSDDVLVNFCYGYKSGVACFPAMDLHYYARLLYQSMSDRRRYCDTTRHCIVTCQVGLCMFLVSQDSPAIPLPAKHLSLM